ncbi:MAG: MaoC/PaaZ C-terminal domain-containing protein [Anaerolineae bacterium]
MTAENRTTGGDAPRGLYFEEFEVGTAMESPGRTVTESDIVNFAGISGDFNQLHTDAEFAKETPFGARIAHGLLGLAMASGLAARLGFIEGTAEAFRSLTWKFRGAIFIGDTIRVEAKVAEKKPVRGYSGGLITFDISVLNQEGKAVQKGEWIVLVKGKAS